MIRKTGGLMGLREMSVAVLLWSMAITVAMAQPQSPEPYLNDGEILRQIVVPQDAPLRIDGWTKQGRGEVYTLAVRAGQSFEFRFSPRSAFAPLVIFDLSRPADDAIFASDVDGNVARLTADADTVWLMRPVLIR